MWFILPAHILTFSHPHSHTHKNIYWHHLCAYNSNLYYIIQWINLWYQEFTLIYEVRNAFVSQKLPAEISFWSDWLRVVLSWKTQRMMIEMVEMQTLAVWFISHAHIRTLSHTHSHTHKNVYWHHLLCARNSNLYYIIHWINLWYQEFTLIYKVCNVFVSQKLLSESHFDQVGQD